MTLKKKINTLRADLMRRLTRNIGSAGMIQQMHTGDKAQINRVLVCRPNHRLGNLLLMTPLLQEITQTLPHARVDLFVKGDLAPTVFKNYDQVGHIIELPKKPFKRLFKYLQGWLMIKKNRYDIVVNVVSTSSSGRLSVQLANAKYKFFGDVDPAFLARYEDHLHVAKYPVYVFRNYLSKLGFTESTKPVPSLNLNLSPAELLQGKKLLGALVGNQKKTICLFTNATGLKIYSESWWQAFYERLKTEFPEYNIIEVLPVEKTSQIGFKAPTYFNKDIRGIGSFIANTDVFIGADSGMMHLATAVQTPTIGLFKVTDLHSFEPYGNSSLAIDTNHSSLEDCILAVKNIFVAVS